MWKARRHAPGASYRIDIPGLPVAILMVRHRPSGTIPQSCWSTQIPGHRHRLLNQVDRSRTIRENHDEERTLFLQKKHSSKVRSTGSRDIRQWDSIHQSEIPGLSEKYRYQTKLHICRTPLIQRPRRSSEHGHLARNTQEAGNGQNQVGWRVACGPMGL